MDDSCSDPGREGSFTEGRGPSPVHIAQVLAPIYISTCTVSPRRITPPGSPAQAMKGDHLSSPAQSFCWSVASSGRQGPTHHCHPLPRRCGAGCRASPGCRTPSPPLHLPATGQSPDPLPSAAPSLKRQSLGSWQAVQDRMAHDRAIYRTIAADIAAIRASMHTLEAKAASLPKPAPAPAASPAAAGPVPGSAAATPAGPRRGSPRLLRYPGAGDGTSSLSDGNEADGEQTPVAGSRPQGSPAREPLSILIPGTTVLDTGRRRLSDTPVPAPELPPLEAFRMPPPTKAKSAMKGAADAAGSAHDLPTVIPSPRPWLDLGQLSPGRDKCGTPSPKVVQFNASAMHGGPTQTAGSKAGSATFASLVLRDVAQDADFRRQFGALLAGVWELGREGATDVRQQLTAPLDDAAYAALLRRINEAAGHPASPQTPEPKEMLSPSIRVDAVRARRNSYAPGTVKETTKLQGTLQVPTEAWKFEAPTPHGVFGRRARSELPPQIIVPEVVVTPAHQTRRHTICAPMQSPRTPRARRTAAVLWALVRQARAVKCFAVLQLCEQLTKFVDDFIFNVYSHFLVQSEPLTFAMPPALERAFGVPFAEALERWGMLRQVEGQRPAIQKPRLSMVLLRYELTSWRIGVCKPLLDAKRRLAHDHVKGLTRGSPRNQTGDGAAAGGRADEAQQR